ncbi:MAG: diguanylate cyclase [Candidatus Brocadia sp. AMX2]|nr:MAG: diguanylate cyclase [Candidatus Brocadia sp. AMX2]
MAERNLRLSLLKRLRQSIALHNFIYKDKNYHVTICCGIAEIRPAVDPFTKNDLIDFADKALFESKKKGRNCVTLYTQRNK